MTGNSKRNNTKKNKSRFANSYFFRTHRLPNGDTILEPITLSMASRYTVHTKVCVVWHATPVFAISSFVYVTSGKTRQRMRSWGAWSMKKLQKMLQKWRNLLTQANYLSEIINANLTGMISLELEEPPPTSPRSLRLARSLYTRIHNKVNSITVCCIVLLSWFLFIYLLYIYVYQF